MFLMKKIVLSILLISAAKAFAYTNNAIVYQTPIKIESYQTQKDDNILELPVHFAKEIILNPQAKKKLREKNIYQIDLVYTRFKESHKFNQIELNNQRIEQLKKLIPELQNNDKIIWNLVEQVSATNKEDANKLFHGFVIHFSQAIDYKTLSSSFEELQKEFCTYNLVAEKGGDLTYESGSTVHFEPNSICHEDGTPAHGEIEVSYREFRNQADILFSGIPMTYNENGETFNFNSAGMFELRATQNGKKLKLTKPANINFMATENLKDMNYYAMDDNTGEWTKIRALQPQTTTLTLGKEVVVMKQWRKNGFGTTQELADTLIEKKIYPKKTVETVRAVTNYTPDAGHTYPVLVQNLQSPSFGVYNCDQAYRIQNKITVSPTFIDKNTNEKITAQHVLCLLDLNVNGSFSFSPYSFTCNAKGKNVLVLFTDDKKIYLLQHEDFTNLNLTNSSQREIALTNMTSEIKTANDLKKYLM
jgi:hypothetical protein